MECESIKDKFNDYINHTALPEDVRIIEEHLCICHSCREYLGKLMDKPLPSPSLPLQNHHSKVGAFEYTIVSVGIAMLAFFIYLLLQ